jgi:hypothetical protein
MITVVEKPQRPTPRDAGFTASANVRVTVEVQNLGPYGADWTAEKIHEQTGKEAIEKVLRLLGVCQHCGKERSYGRFAIVSEPEVTIVSQRRVRP